MTCTGVTGLTRSDAATEAAKSYALAMADTVLVPEGGSATELLTAGAPRGWTDNAYFFNVRLIRAAVRRALWCLYAVDVQDVDVLDWQTKAKRKQSQASLHLCA